MDTSTTLPAPCAYQDDVRANGDIFVHLAKITDITGLDITMDRGLRMTYNGNGCSGFIARPFTPAENVGIESMALTTNVALDREGENADLKGRWFIHHLGAANSWVVDVDFGRHNERWMSIQYSARIWYQGNDFSDLSTTIYHDTEGINTKHGTVDAVFENNTCTGSRVCAKLEKGGEGIVWAYNYTDQNEEDTTPYGCEISFFNHGHYMRESLWEGNDYDCGFWPADRWWGRNGERIMAYRNRGSGTVCRGTGTDNHGWSIVLEDSSRGVYHGVTTDSLNLIGNTAGEFIPQTIDNTPMCPPSIGVTGNDLDTLTGDIWLENNAYRYPGGTFDVTQDTDVSCGTGWNDACPGTNKNVASPDASWDGDYPTSLYRTTAPSWWCQEACAWSQDGIGAFGDNFGGTLCRLPAQIRYEEGAGGCTALDADTTAPTPDPSTWDTVPTMVDTTTITMTADTATDVDSMPVQYEFDCTTDGTASSGWQSSSTYAPDALTPDTLYTFRHRARDAAFNETAWSSSEDATTDADAPADTTAPTPDPATWSQVPVTTGRTGIFMNATIATDADSKPVEYEFDCTTDDSVDRTWSTVQLYFAGGLTPGTLYTFRHRSRDSAPTPNVTDWSSSLSATTQGDVTAPTPNPATWAKEPYATSPTTLSMEATPAYDAVSIIEEYYFACTSHPALSSEWQVSRFYHLSGLDPGVTYEFITKSRDSAAIPNETAWSTPIGVATTTIGGRGAFVGAELSGGGVNATPQ
jgi:hypothetical protein